MNAVCGMEAIVWDRGSSGFVVRILPDAKVGTFATRSSVSISHYIFAQNPKSMLDLLVKKVVPENQGH